MREDGIAPEDWFAGMDFASDVYSGARGEVRSTRRAGASPEADLHDARTVPHDVASYRRQLEEVFGPLETAAGQRLAASVPLRRVLSAWKERGTRQQGEAVFALASEAMGQVFGFAPAPLTWMTGPLRDNAVGLFLRGKGWERIGISASQLGRPPRDFLETVLHEQIHRLQHALTCRLNDPTATLAPLERGLVLYWLRQEPARQAGYAAAARERDPRIALARYREIAIEFHAYTGSERIAAAVLGPGQSP